MGVYVNPGNDGFRLAVQDNIYIDKTQMIACTNEKLEKSDRFLCVSRPRRFGKSMAANMLAAYYSKGCNSEKLFSGKKIQKKPSFLQYLNQYNVISLNIQQFTRKVKQLSELTDCIEKELLQELSREYQECELEIGMNLPDYLTRIFNQDTSEKKGFIFIIDEWDCVFRIAKEDSAAQERYLDFLRDVLKDRYYVTLAYMTGILPIKKYGTHSALNIFSEYSMMEPGELAEYVGFTDSEVEELCYTHQMDFEQVKNWYDGYRFVQQTHIYNPKSVVDAMNRHTLDSYWTATETYEALRIYVDMDFDGLKDAIVTMLGGIPISINSRTFQNDMTTLKSKDDVLSLLVHLGYLGYDKHKQQVFIPNKEIQTEFVNTVEGASWRGVVDAIAESKQLLNATIAKQTNEVADAIDRFHTEIASALVYNDENALSCAVLMAYYCTKDEYLPPIRELPTGKGFADIVYLPKKETNKPALLLEMKWDKTAEGAIQQIKNKEYPEWIMHYTGDILLVGINYDRKNKSHTCAIEKIQK